MIAIATAALFAGGVALWVLAVVVAIVMMGEWADLERVPPKTRRMAQFALSVPLAVMAPASLILETRDFFTLGLIAGAAFFVAIVTRRQQLALGVVYCAIPVLALVFVRRQDDGLLFAFWMLAIVWACDIGAFFAGRAIGGPKLAPRLSPNKTWAGLIGGAIAAMMVLIAFALYRHAGPGALALMVVRGAVIAILAQAGDLFQSWMKRRAGVKDSGRLIPGHGGLFDRVDGLLAVAFVNGLIILPKLAT